MALMIVMVVIALAAVLGFAMVSAGSLQASATASLRYTATAEYVAESGAQAALYYIQNPSSSPVALVSGKYPGQTGMTFGGTVPGSADVTVSYAGAGKYTIVSKGYATTTNGTTIAKTVTAVAQLVTKYQPTLAAQFDNSVYLNKATVTGNVEANGTVTVATALNSKIVGTARGTARAGLGTIATWQAWGAGESAAVPQYNDVKDYTGSYKILGHTYQAQLISATSLTGAILPTATDLLTNPAGVYYTNGDLDLNAGNVIAGTLIVKGKLNVKGVGNIITPLSGFPAVVAKNDIQFSGLLPSLTANGLVYTGSQLKGGPAGSAFTVLGMFIATGSTPIDTAFAGQVLITYDVTKLLVTDFTPAGAQVLGVRVVSWSMS
jgi:hypothetical protein